MNMKKTSIAILMGIFVIALLGIAGIVEAGRSDFNSDGKVDLNDFFDFSSRFGNRAGDAAYESKYDLNNNGRIDEADFGIFQDDFSGRNLQAKNANSYALNKLYVFPRENRVDAHVTLRSLGDKSTAVRMKVYLLDSQGKAVARAADNSVKLDVREVHREIFTLEKPAAGKYVLVVEVDNGKTNGYLRRAREVVLQ